MSHLVYAHIQRAVDALTGPVGSTVAISLMYEDPEDTLVGVVREQVVMADRLAAVVLDVEVWISGGGHSRKSTRRTVVPWANVRTLVIQSTPQEPAQ